MGKTFRYDGEEKALSSPILHRAILEPRKQKTRRRKFPKGGKTWLEFQERKHQI